MNSLTPSELTTLNRDWRFWARDKQLPPDGDWFVWLMQSGRGTGKTWVGSHLVIEHAREYPRFPIALVGQTKADVRDTMVEVGDSSILNVSPPDFRPDYEPSKRRLTWKNGAVAMIYSGDEPDQLRGPQHGFAWVDELAKFKYPQETWDNLEMGLRLGPNPQIAVTTTPRPILIIRQLLADPDVVVTRESTFENIANLSPRFIERLKAKYEGTRLGRQELYGDILEDTPGALWKRDVLDAGRVKDYPHLVRIVVAIDPAVTATEDSDETGIIVAGVDDKGVGYVLDDLTVKASPDAWARRAVEAYHRHHADRIVAESNNGGDMVEHTIRTVDRTVSLKQVKASRGKYTRAEPIAAMYEQGRIHHVGLFAELEDQLCTWVPGDDSPDRLDAMVWALTDLMISRGGAWILR